MKRFTLLALFSFTLSTLIGCGGSSETAPAAEQDELTKWVNDNPAPESVELEE